MRWRDVVRAALVAGLLGLLAARSEAAVNAWLNSDTVAPGDTLQLTLERDGRTGAEPDLSPLRRDFDVLGTSRSSSIQIVNGSASSSTQVMVSLAPKRSGKLTVPAIAWGSEHSDPLTLNVASAAGGNGASGAAPGAGGEVFLSTKVDPGQPYVQSAVQVTVRVYTAEPLYQAGLELPGSDDVLIQQIGSDEHGTAERNGRDYRVITRHYVLFPQHSGAMKLPGAVLSAQVASRQSGAASLFGNDPFFKDFFGQSAFGGMTARPIRVHGDPIALQVRPRPAGAAASYWLPARHVTLTSQWNPDALRARAGDPLTVTLHLQAEGLTAAQLPDLSALLHVPGGLKVYPDQARLHNATRNGTVLGSRDQSIALIADQPGHFTLPAFTLHWWDTQADRPREISLPARSLVIVPAPGQSSTPSAGAAPGPLPARTPEPHAAASPVTARSPSSSPAAGAPAAGPAPGRASPSEGAAHGPWPWISGSAIALWLATLVAWYLSRRRPSTSGGPTPRGAARPRLKRDDPRTVLRAACRDNDALAARRSLLAWAAEVWPESPPGGLKALGERLQEPERAALLRDLDRACYAGGGWQGEAFAAAFRDLPPGDRKSSRGDRELAPLYH